jgi:hypothetical protein
VLLADGVDQPILELRGGVKAGEKGLQVGVGKVEVIVFGGHGDFSDHFLQS